MTPPLQTLSRRAALIGTGVLLLRPIRTAAHASTPAPVTSLTILRVGADAREGTSLREANTDIVIAAHVDLVASAIRMVSVLRDTRVSLADGRATKITHVMKLGQPDDLAAMVEALLGITLDGYVVIGYLGAARVIDAIGGVTIDNPEPFMIQDAVFPAGRLELDGHEAMLYARYRGDAGGDVARVERQYRVFSAIMEQAGSASVGTLVRIGSGMLGRALLTDLSLIDLAGPARQLLDADAPPSVNHRQLGYTASGPMWDDVYGQELWMGEVDPTTALADGAWLIGR